MLRWAPDSSSVLYTRFIPGSHPDCCYDLSLPNHEELVFAPDLAKGGTQLCRLDLFTGNIYDLTKQEEGKWEHHPGYSSDGSHIVFSRAYVGYDNELWIMDKDGKDQRFLTKGYEGKGAVIYAFQDIKLEIPVQGNSLGK